MLLDSKSWCHFHAVSLLYFITNQYLLQVNCCITVVYQVYPSCIPADSTGSNVSVFWCSTREISVNSDKKEVLEVQFLPFSTGHFQCSVLLISEEVGDIVYSIEAESCLPLPAALPFQPSSHIVRLSSAEDAEKRHSFVGDNARTVYWRCNINEQITEDIVIPLVNEARENALGKFFIMIAAISLY